MKNLPPGWSIVTIADVTEYLSRGKQPKYIEYSSLPVINQRSIQWSGIQDEYLKYVDPLQFNSWEPERFIQPGDILWNSTGRGTVGRACLVTQKDIEPPKVVDSHVTILRPNQKAINPDFLFAWIRSAEVQNLIESLATGATNQIELGQKAISSVNIPVAPLNEQKRIIEKLEHLLVRLDECRVRLKRVPLILNLFRQSVLNAAMSGNLTKDWRENQIETRNNTFNFLARIEEEHKQGCHGKYQKPLLPNKTISKDVPQSWSLVTLDQLSTLITSGSRGWAKYYSNSGAYFIRAQNINSDRLILDDAAYVDPPDGSEGERTKVQQGDLLITITGANVTKAALVDCDLPAAYVNQHIGLVRLVSSVCQKFIHFWIISPSYGRAQLKENIHGGKPGLNLTNLREVLIALPSLEEQEVIVRQVEDLLNYADKLQAYYQNSLCKVEQVASSLLETAFSGELVEQNPNEETASALLERIQSEKAATPKRVSNYRKPRMPKMTEEYVKESIDQLTHEMFSFDELKEKMPGDYDVLKDILFNLLDDSNSGIIQVFDEKSNTMQFVRGSK